MIVRTFACTLALCFLALPLAAGCGGDSFGDKIDEAESLGLEVADRLCDCYEANGYASKEACLADNPQEGYTPEERACVIDAAALDQEASDANLDCILGALRTYSSCVDSNLDCADQSSIEGCGIEFFSTATNCPPLPADVEAALEACETTQQ